MSDRVPDLMANLEASLVRARDARDDRPTLFDAAADEIAAVSSVTGTRPPRSHRGDPATSDMAARDNLPRAGTQRARVIAELARHLIYGCTDYELSQALGILRTAAGTRRKELAEGGLVEATGERRETDTGSLADVYRLTDLGRAVALRLADTTG